MLARCARIASTIPRFPIIHTRAFLAVNDQNIAAITNLIHTIDYPPPPVGTVYGPPNKKGGNPLDEKVMRGYAEKPLRYSLYCQSTRNNTITTLMDNEFNPVAFHSGGTCGFKKVNRSSYEAGYQCAVRMFKTIEQIRKKKRIDLALYFKGFGQGRDAMQKAFMTSEGDRIRELVASVTDRTPIKIGGTRAKKARRL